MSLPPKQGLYDPRNEHDSCGVGFVANIKGQKSHQIVGQGLQLLINLDHRGAVGADPLVGDGAGILIQIPDALLREWAKDTGVTLPPPGEYAVGMCFLPREPKAREIAVKQLEHFIKIEGQKLLGWRDVPTDPTGLGKTVLEQMPLIRQAIVTMGPHTKDQDSFERKLLTIRKQTQNPLEALAKKHKQPAVTQLYMPSFSTRTVVYKGLLLAHDVGRFYLDLQNPLTTSAIALVHQRFSTNTFPSWKLAHPYRFIAHNGEINTVRGNVNWMNARRRSMQSDLLGPDLDKMWPLIPHGQSDTACLDNALEVLVAGGYPLAHAVMMLIPEAWAGNKSMDAKRKAFYEYHAALLEPWDGPAAIAFTDGRQIGATLDRNGLRPARYIVTDDDLVILASESGVLPVPEEKIKRKWRLQPGKMLLIDLEEGRIVEDEEIKKTLSQAEPYEEWLKAAQFKLEELPDLPEDHRAKANDPGLLLDKQQAFGYTQEDLQFFLEPMAQVGDDPLGSMGVDTPLAVLSNKSKLLYNYFKQNFAQVTNPPIDPIREELVMSLVSMIGPRPNLLGREAGNHKRLEVHQPVLTNADVEKIRSISELVDGAFRTATIDCTWPAIEGSDGLSNALLRICHNATDAVLADNNILILSDRATSPDRVPVPALLATAAIHHHLIRQGLRMQTGLVVETGEAREVHHFCALAGYGAEAINPYIAFETLEQIRVRQGLSLKPYEVQKNYIKAVGKGILKVMSKMGISTYQSYCGAQIFDAVGLSSDFIEKFFTGTATTIEGIGLKEVGEESVRRHRDAYGDNPIYRGMLDVGGDYAYRLRGEDHAWTPESVSRLQHAVRGNNPAEYQLFAQSINEQNERLLTLRGLMQFKTGEGVPLDEVEAAVDIVKRFSTGASPLTSLTHAGSPWEIGLAETQQTLVLNGLRGRIAVQVDGGLRTGRDVAIGALLGADEFGFATAPLIASGCIMMRKCHLNTCPVGVATQDPILRKRFTGTPEHVINYFFFVAEELREIMAELGFRTVAEMIGRVDKIDLKKAIAHWKAKGVDLSKVLHQVQARPGVAIHNCETQNHALDSAIDHDLIKASLPSIEGGQPVVLERTVRNVDRTVGAMLSGEVARRHGHAGLPEDTIKIRLTGTAGQSFGAFLSRGVSLELIGDGNDYVGKGLSGGRIVVKPPAGLSRDPSENIIVGNTVLYGAIAGEAYFQGVAGERFAVRNSGAIAVVEGTGDHGCEYMTGGVVVVLGKTGRNFAAGMSGGIAYVYDEHGDFEKRCNLAQVKLEKLEAASGSDDPELPRQRSVSVYDPSMGDLLRFDAERLRILIERHLLQTGSSRARQLLDNWDQTLERFVKVMPTDYAAALASMKAARAKAVAAE